MDLDLENHSRLTTLIYMICREQDGGEEGPSGREAAKLPGVQLSGGPGRPAQGPHAVCAPPDCCRAGLQQVQLPGTHAHRPEAPQAVRACRGEAVLHLLQLQVSFR